MRRCHPCRHHQSGRGSKGWEEDSAVLIVTWHIPSITRPGNLPVVIARDHPCAAAAQLEPGELVLGPDHPPAHRSRCPLGVFDRGRKDEQPHQRAETDVLVDDDVFDAFTEMGGFGNQAISVRWQSSTGFAAEFSVNEIHAQRIEVHLSPHKRTRQSKYAIA